MSLTRMLTVAALFALGLAARAQDDQPADEAGTEIKVEGRAEATGGDITIAPARKAEGGVGIGVGAKDTKPANPRPAVSTPVRPRRSEIDGIAKKTGADACRGSLKPGERPDPKTLTTGRDALDLSKVIYVKGAGIAEWRVTSTLSDVKVGGGQLCTPHTMAGKWPQHDFFGDPKNPVEGNQWVFAFIKGHWYGGAGEWLRPGQTCKSVEAADVGCGVFYDSEPLKSWRPAHGELVGIAVSAPARAGQWTVAERSNVVMVRWP